MQPLISKPFDVDRFLATLHAKKNIIHFRKNQAVFFQGQRSDAIFYIEKGHVKLIVISEQGKEAILGVLHEGDLLGESCIASDQPLHFHTAIAISDVHVVKIDRNAVMSIMLSASDDIYAFVSLILRNNLRIQETFANSLLESSEKRLARALITVSHVAQGQSPSIPKITQQDWADMIGITRQRVNFLLRRFRELGFIEDHKGLRVNPSILSVLEQGRENVA